MSRKRSITRRTECWSYGTCIACGVYHAAVSVRATWPNGEVRPDVVLCHVCIRALARRVAARTGGGA